jgi:tetratricopeptide (TPR) repeat protein/tRNA A-37 threonylcarbamoyl transferase component Bud32
MTPEQALRVESAFHEALRRDPPERPALLDALCQDDAEVRAAVERLLAEDEGAGEDHFLTLPNVAPLSLEGLLRLPEGSAGLRCPRCQASIDRTSTSPEGGRQCARCGSTFRLADVPADSVESAAVLGRRVGRFELLSLLGSGAFGTVYRAHDPQLDRLVAVKVPRRGALLTRQEVDRFLREARSTAQLRHPGIVPMYEVGEDDGLPYLVSEFVDGATLTDRMASGELPPRETAELIARVADALEHAHRRGVVHRDVKPSNIMVRADGSPAVMDFGLAKRSAGEATVTLDGQVLGTPAFMSPEQARGEGHSVDGRSDVYALGAILYRLLTGELPFRGTVRMVLHQVLHEEPRPPRGLNDRVPRDLETICLKALAKEPSRRYAAASDLAADLSRWLAGEPIQARPVGRVEHLWRWCLREPRVAGLAASLVLVLLGAACASTWAAIWYYDQAERQGRLAASEAGARAVALAQKAEAEDHKHRAESRERLAIDAVRKFADAVVGNPDLRDREDLRSLRRGLIEGPLEFFKALRDELQASDDTDPESLGLLADAAHTHAHLTDELTDKGRALQAHQEALAIWTRLVERWPSNARYQAKLASLLADIGDLRRDMGRHELALDFHRRAAEVQERLTREDPTAPEPRSDLARILCKRGDVERALGQPGPARQSLERALAIVEKLTRERPDVASYQDQLAGCLANLGALQVATGSPGAAIRLCERALEIVGRLAEGGPTSHRYLHDLAMSHANLGGLKVRVGRPDEALASCRRAVSIMEGLASSHPTIVGFRRDLAATRGDLGRVLAATGDPEGAASKFRQALDALDQLRRDDPSNSTCTALAARLHHEIGRLHAARADHSAALPSLEESARLWELLATTQPSVPEHQGELARCFHEMGSILRDTGQHEAALVMCRRALGAWERLAREHPSDTVYPSGLAASHNQLGGIHHAMSQPEAAIRSCQEALAIWERLAREHPAVTKYQSGVAECHTNIGLVRAEMHQDEAALGSLREALAIQEALAREHETVAAYGHALGFTLSHMATIYVRQRSWEQAHERLLQALTIQRGRHRGEPRDAANRQLYVRALKDLVQVCTVLRRPEEAADAARELVSVVPRDAVTLYHAARVFCHCAYLAEQVGAVGSRDRGDATYHDEAMASLRAAIAVGWGDRAQAATSPDLAPLRGRPDFQELFLDPAFPTDPFVH